MSLSKFTLSRDVAGVCEKKNLLAGFIFAKDLRDRRTLAKTANKLGREILLMTYHKHSTPAHFMEYDTIVTLRHNSADNDAIAFLVMRRLCGNSYETRFEAVHPAYIGCNLIGCVLDIAAEVAVFDTARRAAVERQRAAAAVSRAAAAAPQERAAAAVSQQECAAAAGNAAKVAEALAEADVYVETVMGITDQVTIVTYIDVGGPAYIECALLDVGRGYVYAGLGDEPGELKYTRTLIADRRKLQMEAVDALLHPDNKSRWSTAAAASSSVVEFDAAAAMEGLDFRE